MSALPSATAPGSKAAAAAQARSARLLHGPVLPTLLLLAAPNLIVMLSQAAANFLESYFVGLLGVDALAGAALVFPLVMLMQTMSAGGMGGGISSAIARAIGAGDRDKAEALALHALLIALGFGLLCMLGGLVGGPLLYRAMTGSFPVQQAALAYSNAIFIGAVFLWLANGMASVLRGSGNMALPALVLSGGVLLLLVASPLLIFGWGPLPALGIMGAGLALVLYYVAAAAVMLTAVLRGSGGVKLHFKHTLRWPLFRDILGVGGPAIVNNITLNLSVLTATALVSPLGSPALAGFGLGIRLEYLQIPIVFGFGAAMVAMVGMNTGAGQLVRARRVAWTGALMAAGATAIVGLAAALFPAAWLGLFTQNAEAIRVGTQYLRTVGPAYGLFGLGLSLYFASQGARRMGWSLVAGAARLAIVYVAGHLALKMGAGLPTLLVIMVVALAAYALLNAWPWFARPQDRPRG
ncbi:MATE family efflux transporter [Pseudorhodoferax sp. Leaf267]|uniref:MATE family efflux transporter n=1 Tax=Pseudorhodoferax sp. Leaf267 TaxID=1736316 RepID=UPI0006F9576B|nr:MATE family efflux transporter [Pseudorhodoferax sp. Leaf267]KQP15041.1 MATE family efflux transporter [Pseudorhodoferax sp. Leaf267]